MCEEHNGWVNRETWAMALHLSNDEWFYETINLLIESLDNPTPVGAGEAIRQWVEEFQDRLFFPEPGDNPTPRKEWFNLFHDVGSVYRVDWTDVAKSFMEE